MANKISHKISRPPPYLGLFPKYHFLVLPQVRSWYSLVFKALQYVYRERTWDGDRSMRRLQTYWNKERMEAFLYPHRDLRKLLLAHMWHGSEVQKDVGAGSTKRYIYIWGIPRGTSDCLMGRRKSIWIITGIAFLPHLGGNLVHIRHFKMGFTSGNH